MCTYLYHTPLPNPIHLQLGHETYKVGMPAFSKIVEEFGEGRSVIVNAPNTSHLTKHFNNLRYPQ